MHVNVYNRQTGALVAQQAVFTNLPDKGDTENSLIAVNDSILVENNYGNLAISSTSGARTTEPDIDRVDFNPGTGQSEVVWENAKIAVPSIVSQLSTADGLEYTYAKDAHGWYWAAVSYQNGQVVAKGRIPQSKNKGCALVKGGELGNNFYGGITVAPNGTAYAGVLGGIVAWRPRGRVQSHGEHRLSLVRNQASNPTTSVGVPHRAPRFRVVGFHVPASTTVSSAKPGRRLRGE